MAIQCSVCKGVFNDSQSYQAHLRYCGSVYGGAADVSKASQQETAKEGGTGGGRP